jgi:hypothetical protein
MGHVTTNLRETGLFRFLVWKRLFSAKTSWLIGSPLDIRELFSW